MRSRRSSISARWRDVYSYQVDGVEVKADVARQAESALTAALGLAALQSFQMVKPVVLCLNGQPYRRVSVEFIEHSPTYGPIVFPRKT